MNQRSDTPKGECDCGRYPHRHPSHYLCRIGFNEFLGEVQARLLKAGYNPPIWPDPSISDQGDVDAALDSCVKWCAARLDEAAQRSETVALQAPTEAEIAAYRDLFRAELSKRMDTKHHSASPSTEAHAIALRRFVEARNARK